MTDNTFPAPTNIREVPMTHATGCNDGCDGNVHHLVAVNVQTGEPLDPIAAIEARLVQERDAVGEAGNGWHVGARAAFARALDIVREVTA